MVTLMRLLDLTLVTMIGLAFSACATSSSNERYLRSEVAPLAENLLRCPQNQILTQWQIPIHCIRLCHDESIASLSELQSNMRERFDVPSFT